MVIGEYKDVETFRNLIHAPDRGKKGYIQLRLAFRRAS